MFLVLLIVLVLVLVLDPASLGAAARLTLRATGILWLAACAGPGGGSEPPPARRLILTSFQPLYSFTARVAEGSPCLEVVNLAPRSLGPHDFDPDDPAHSGRCRDLVRRAEAIVTLRSLPLAPASDRLYAWCRRRNIRIVEIDPGSAWDAAAPRLPLIAEPVDTARARREQVPPGAGGGRPPNPHVWLSLTHAVRLVEGIARDLSALDPDHAPLYRANAERHQKALRDLKAHYERVFAGVERLTVAALTEGFPYLTADFGIDVADYILEPEGPAEVAARVKAAGVTVVLAEEAPSAGVARAVEAAGARVVVLTTIEEGWGEGEALDPDGYLKAMRANLRRLDEAFHR